jgi:hypothetical protein
MSMNRSSNDVNIRTPLDVRLRCPGRAADPVSQRNRLMGMREERNHDIPRVDAIIRLRVESFDSGRDDANVSSELEDQVVDIRRRHGTQGW